MVELASAGVVRKLAIVDKAEETWLKGRGDHQLVIARGLAKEEVVW